MGLAHRWQQLHPDDVQGIWWQSQTLIRFGRCPEAMDIYRHAAQRMPKNTQLRRNWWTCAITCGDLAAELEAAREWVATVPDNVEALHAYAMALNANDRPREALSAAQRALAFAPDNQDVLLQSAGALCRLGRWTEAHVAYQRCNQQALTDNQGMWFSTWMAAQSRRDLAARLETSAGWTAALPDDLLAWVFRIRDLAESGQYESTLEATQRCLTLDPDNIPAREYHGMALYRTDRLDELAEVLDRWPEFDPGAGDSNFKAQPDLTLLKAHAAADLHRWADAARAAALVTHVDGFTDAWDLLVSTLLELGQPDQALAAAERWITAAPDDVEARIARVAALFAAERIDHTVAAIEQGWPGSDTDIHVLTIKAKALQALGRHAEAVAAAACAVDLAAVHGHATPPGAWVVQASSLRVLGHHDGAAAAAQKLVELNPQNADHWSLLALAYTAAKRWQDALDTAEEEIKIRPTSGAWSRKVKALLWPQTA